MRGRHAIRTFKVPVNEEVNLPEGWKPFGVADSTSRYAVVVARKWERTGE